MDGKPGNTHFHIRWTSSSDDLDINNDILLYVTALMRHETKKRLKCLCEQASIEQNGENLVELLRELNDLLEEKRREEIVEATASPGEI
jgi:hypothetical protein